MAHWKQLFKSKYLRAADIDKPFVATVKQIVDENVGQGDTVEEKPVAYWKEPAYKPCVLNPTRAEALADVSHADDPVRWPGTRVLVRRGTTRFKGDKVECVEFAAPPSAQAEPEY